jgi:hypothetical protein
VGPTLSLAKGERHPNQESATATAVDIFHMSSSVNWHRHRSTTSNIDTFPALNNRGIVQEKTGTTATVTGSLLQKPVTVAAGNLGSCDKNPGKADTKDETGAIVENNRGNKKEGWVDPRGAGAERGWDIDKGGSRPAVEKM